jgi:hypothetical protein
MQHKNVISKVFLNILILLKFIFIFKKKSLKGSVSSCQVILNFFFLYWLGLWHVPASSIPLFLGLPILLLSLSLYLFNIHSSGIVGTVELQKSNFKGNKGVFELQKIWVMELHFSYAYLSVEFTSRLCPLARKTFISICNRNKIKNHILMNN